ncbi:MAG: HPP family protein [Proteobacteria bacterium]|nr:HPP family protein [Pseudomonadota bacterium]
MRVRWDPTRSARLPGRIVAAWGTTRRPARVGVVWMAALLGLLVWLAGRHDGVVLVPPFVATMTILCCLPEVAIAQPFAVVAGSTLGAAIGTLVVWVLGCGAGPAMVAALTALIVLPRAHAYHPPGVALALYPALVHPGPWFAVAVVLPFVLTAVGSAAVLSRLLRGWPRYPVPL